MDNCNFTIKHYEDILRSIKSNNFVPIFFNQINTYKKEIIIRHDIDLDVNSALVLSRIESKHNIKSTYFFWLTSPFYNIFDPENKNKILEIIDLGHEIGLHFNGNCYSVKNSNELISKINLEKNILEQYLNVYIKIVSFHMPSKSLINNNITMGNIDNTYHSKYFKQYKYLSDSAKNWRDGCVCKYLSNENNKKIQVLFHPFWWKDVCNEKEDEKICYINNRFNALSNEWEKHIQV